MKSSCRVHGHRLIDLHSGLSAPCMLGGLDQTSTNALESLAHGVTSQAKSASASQPAQPARCALPCCDWPAGSSQTSSTGTAALRRCARSRPPARTRFCPGHRAPIAAWEHRPFLRSSRLLPRRAQPSCVPCAADLLVVAEAVRFELTVGLPPRQFSRLQP